MKTKETRYLIFTRICTITLFGIVTIALIYIYVLFLTSDVSVYYVWKYTNAGHPLLYKISGVLAGMAGSLLFWVWMIILPWTYEEVKATRRPIDIDLMDWTRIALFGILAVLLFVLSLHKIFDPTTAEDLAVFPNGQGLNPLLQTELMAVHPPVVFIAYGFLAIPFAAGAAYLITGNKDWTSISLNWSRAGWLFLTLGLGLGALWAYVVLGWGGYWAWDPVETSSLLPWILLTGFLHVQLMNKRKRDYPLLAPILGIFTFLLVLFATFTTRAGGLWVSVHDFGDADLSISPWTRLVNILSTSDTILIYFILMIAIIGLTSVLVIYRLKKMNGNKEERAYSVSELINDEILMMATVFMSVIITVLILVILVMGVNGLAPENFNMPVGTLTLISVMVLIMCLTWKDIGRQRLVYLSVATVVIAFLAYLLFPGFKEVAASVPILVLALVGTLYKMAKSFRPRSVWRSMSFVSAHVIHFSVVLIVVGYVGSNFMVSEDTISVHIGDAAGADVGTYTFTINDIHMTNVSIFVDVEIRRGDSIVKRLSPGIQLIDNQLRNEIRVAGTWTEDIYLTYVFNQASLAQGIVDIEVKILPLMKSLWAGMWLMSAAIIIRIAVEKTTGKRRQPVEKLEEERDDDYYEDRLEKELGEPEDIEDSSGPPEPGDAVKDDDYYEALLDKELGNGE